MELQKFEYLENKKSFLDEIKNIFQFLKGYDVVKNKNLVKNSGHKIYVLKKYLFQWQYVTSVWNSLLYSCFYYYPSIEISEYEIFSHPSWELKEFFGRFKIFCAVFHRL